jgi:hypothetical protein
MSYNTKNFEKQGGALWYVGGVLQVAGSQVPASGTQAAHIVNAAGAAGANPTQAEYADLVAKFNALVAAVQGVGIVAAS